MRGSASCGDCTATPLSSASCCWLSGSCSEASVDSDCVLLRQLLRTLSSVPGSVLAGRKQSRALFSFLRSTVNPGCLHFQQHITTPVKNPRDMKMMAIFCSTYTEEEGGNELVNSSPGTGVTPLSLVPDCWLIHLRSLLGVQGLSSTMPLEHLLQFWQISGEFSSRKVPGLHSHTVFVVTVHGTTSVWSGVHTVHGKQEERLFW